MTAPAVGSLLKLPAVAPILGRSRRKAADIDNRSCSADREQGR
jgi:hypothetical protein